jgi:NAD(P)H dehydrogenase (quinone)
MTKILIIYFSQTGNTEKMAYSVAEGVREEGVEPQVKKVQEAAVDDLLDVDGIVIGSPTYFGAMAAEMKSFLDQSVVHFNRLKGKIGGAFASSALLGGGNETTVLAILQALLIHGMIVEGTTEGGHYGPVALGSPDQRSTEECKQLGRRVARLAKKLCSEFPG